MISSIPSMHANTVAPYAPLGRQAVGQESTDLKTSSFKPLEQAADSARSENKRNPNTESESGTQTSRAVNTKEESQGDKERKQKEQRQINQLAAIDRAVRAHEAAHAATAGEFAGTTSYTYTKGPDGISYVTAGEVSIDSSPVPNNPEATIRKAQQIRQAANAPVDPSPQDRKVAAQAAQMEMQARAELLVQQAEARKAKEAGADVKTESAAPVDVVFDAQKLADEAKKAEEKRKLEKAEEEKQAAEQAQREADRRAIFDRINKSSQRTAQKLLEINSVQGYSSLGNFISSKV